VQATNKIIEQTFSDSVRVRAYATVKPSGFLFFRTKPMEVKGYDSVERISEDIRLGAKRIRNRIESTASNLTPAS
jgi:hypothetical protein